MINFLFPKWLKELLAEYSDNEKLKTSNLAILKGRLRKFEVENPLVSIVIPAWNEEENIIKTIASLADNEFDFPCELFVVNNNSTDNTQAVLDRMGVRSMIETNQGIAPARRRGLLEARGKYHLCCDSDTIYPPTWIKKMTETLQKNEGHGVACIYGSYSFIPSEGKSRFVMALYETGSSVIRFFKSKETETRRVMGFNFGFSKAVALEVNGFIMDKPRKFRNELGSADYVADSEDGLLAFNIKKAGYKILYVNNRKSRVWTSDRRLLIDGGLVRAIGLRLIKIINRKAFDKIARS
ncbi:MAG: glycosyltransferase family 2 protein [Bacteroidales bacterium]|nr:glycosyltransferase family 2 protein [Bacteroidales bacterium]